MYVPILKNRLYENKFLRDNSYLFDKNVSPLIEVLELKIGRTKKTIPEIIQEYDKTLNSMYFLDFFTFTHGEYSRVDLNQVEFSIKIQSEKNYKYDDLLMECTGSNYCIPVISIKEARVFMLDQNRIKKTILDLQKHKDIIAVRISASLFDTYINTIDSVLRDQDYFFYDINEENIEPRYFDLITIRNLNKKYRKLVIHSPRPSKLNNGSYSDGYYTDLIDNELRNTYKLNGFTGFSDYAGLKNVLPTSGGNGQGAALGLFYVNEKNAFFSIMNQDTTKGARGYAYVIREAFAKHKIILNPSNDCPAFDYIDNVLRSRGKSGAWGQWKYITILRYISQIKMSTNSHL